MNDDERPEVDDERPEGSAMKTPTPLDVFGCPLDGINLIEASAGTGKTWNLCGLYLRLLLERRLEVAQILVVTFTTAATAELRDRIRSRIVETLARLRGDGAAAAGDPFVDTLLATLRRDHALVDADAMLRLDHALHTFDEAAIFTIHSFCQRALGDLAFASGMPMTLALADDREMQQATVNDFWRRHVAGDALPDALAGHLLDRHDSPKRWAALLKRRLAKPLSTLRWPEGIDAPAPPGDDANADADADPDADADAAHALAEAHAAARAVWSSDRDAIVAGVTEALPRLSGVTYKPASVAEAAASWSALLAGTDALDAPAALPKLDLFTARRLVPKKGAAPPEAHPFFDLAQALLDQRAAVAESLELARLRLLRALLSDGPAQLRQAKRERRVIAFDDMLLNLHERLTGGAAPGLAAALKARFPAALIDEFQDTDPLQFAIFDAIYGAGDAPLFLVGDPKQAIYSFRHADLHTYLHARSRAGAEYTLAENQRSTQPLLDALNALFSANARAFMLPGLGYQQVALGAKPRPVFTDHSAPRAALQLWSLPGAAAGGTLRKPAARQASATACAGEIARLLGAARRGEVTLDGRALAAGDIAVLVRSHAHGAAMRRALAGAGVGSVELSQASVYASVDADELARVLAAVLEPTRERLLRAALATELMGRDAAALDALAADDDALLDLITRFAASRETWRQRGVGVMLRQFTVREGVGERLLARPDGERRLTNLLHLSECLHEAAAQHDSPEALLRWLQAQRHDGNDARGDDSAQLRLESDRDLVQIVTIHKSKGLEYPIVFCPFLWDGHAGPSAPGTGGLEYHDADGRPTVDFRALDKPALERINARRSLDRAAESLRLVYVALTRAVQRCYLVVGGYLGARDSLAESRRGPLNWLVAGEGVAPSDWPSATVDGTRIDAAWAALAAHHAPQIGLAPLPQGAPTPLVAAPTQPERLAALDPPRALPAPWWIGSYSSLTHGARHESAAVDHDLRVLPPASPEAPEAIESPESPEPSNDAAAFTPQDDDILRFPRGALAGECVHAVFERVDFTQAASRPAAIAAALRLRPPAPGGSHAALPNMLANMLADVLNTPLPPGGFTLAAVPPTRCLVELEFNLPAGRVDADALAAVLRAHGYAVPALTFSVLRGYLRGFIDLVFEHGGRFHIVDWKSNHLGATPAHYGREPLARAMAEHGYHLQYLLYTVALHRYLRRRVAGYDFETHLGSVLYLFVRGVRPGWRMADGAPCGVFAHRPTRAAIEQLSALFEPMRETA